MRPWLVIAAGSGLIAVLVGAVAAHVLEGRLSATALGWMETALLYQILHVAGLLAVSVLSARDDARLLRLAGWGFAVGTALFCGLLYAMALGAPRALGAVVPLGGLAFIGGWLALACYALGSPCGGKRS